MARGKSPRIVAETPKETYGHVFFSTVQYVPDEDAKEDTSKAPVRLLTEFLQKVPQ